MNNFLTNEESLRRQRRATVVYSTATVLTLVVTTYLLWALREMILPAIIGMVIAYICLPLIGYLKDKGMPRLWAVICLSGFFCLFLFSTIDLVGNIIPDQKTELELQVRFRYKINEKFNQTMGLSEGRKTGNWFYTLFGRELEPLRDNLDGVLRLSGDDNQLFSEFYRQEKKEGLEPLSERYWQYHQANRQRDTEKAKLAKKNRRKVSAGEKLPSAASKNNAESSSLLLMIFNALSLWLITPLVFLVLLFDNGKLKKSLVRAVPNRYFELTLTILENINEALGRYLRGTSIECFLVGTSFTLCLFLVGLDMQWAATIGIIAGLANAIPFLGPGIGLLVGVLYAIMAEDVSPVLPFIDGENLLLAIIVVVVIVQLADNALFQPYVLGSAVDLHPLTVILGVTGGAVIFGFAGMLFAIPVIMVVKVIVSTMFRQFRAYYII
jgi:predicted PurR-regulated permease PerM